MYLSLLLTLSLLLLLISSMAPPNDNPIPSFFFFFKPTRPPQNSVHFSVKGIPVLFDDIDENNITTFTSFPSVLRFTNDAPAPSAQRGEPNGIVRLKPETAAEDPNCQYQTEMSPDKSTYLAGLELRYQRVIYVIWFAPLIWLLIMMTITRTPTSLVVHWKIIHKSAIRLLILLSICSLIPQDGLCQQTYVGVGGLAIDGPSGCTRKVDASPGYTNNGVSRSCHALLTFRAAGQYRTIRSISGLFKTDPSSVSMMNGPRSNISETTVLEVNRLVVVRANYCNSNTSNYYQMKVASYVTHKGDTVYSIANQVYQGLTTCRAIFDHNPTIFNHTTGRDKDNITTGTEMVVPLRCACPTKRQTKAGIKSLMTYIVEDGDTVGAVSQRFKVDQGLMMKANKLSKHDKIDPDTTLLVPFIQTQRPNMSAGSQSQSPSLDQNYTTQSPSNPMTKSNGGGLIGSIFQYIREHQLIYKVVGGIIGALVGGFGVRIIIQNCTCCNIQC